MSMMLFLFELGLTIAEVSLEGLLKSCLSSTPSSPAKSSVILSLSKRSICLGEAVMKASFLKGGDETNEDRKGRLLFDNMLASSFAFVGDRAIRPANRSSSFSST